MHYVVECTDERGQVVWQETFVGVSSLASLFLQLSRSWELTDNIVEINIVREKIDG